MTASSTAPFSDTGGADWAAGLDRRVRECERTSRAWTLVTGASVPMPLAPSSGHVLALDPATGSGATLLVRDDALWLLRAAASAPVAIAKPLLASAAPSGCYGSGYQRRGRRR